MIRTFIIGGAFALAASGASAALINFEEKAPLTGAGAPHFNNVGQSYTNGSITFTSSESMQLVQTGGKANGFVPNDTPEGTGGGNLPFGEIFLTGDFDDNTDMTLSFATALSGLTFDIADIDGSGTNNERFTFEAFSGGSAVAGSFQEFFGEGRTDASVVTINFGGIGTFDEIRIFGTTPGGTRNIGWGIDNINTVENNPAPNPVPLPAGAILMLTALGGFGVMRSRKRQS